MRFVSPNGSNAWPGTPEQPKRTASMAYVDAPGPLTIYLSPGSVWSDGAEGLGLTAGQGCHLSGGIIPPGFLAFKPTVFSGIGTDSFGRCAWYDQAGVLQGYIELKGPA